MKLFTTTIIALFASIHVHAHALAFVSEPEPVQTTSISTSTPKLAARDFSITQDIFARLEHGFQDLQVAARFYRGNPKRLPIMAHQILDRAEADIKDLIAMKPLNHLDVLMIVLPSHSLIAQGNAFATQLLAVVEDVRRARQCGSIQSVLRRGAQVSANMVAALSSKVPADIRHLVQAQGNSITVTFGKSLHAYRNKDCRDY